MKNIYNYFRNRIIDININNASYKKRVIAEIKKSRKLNLLVKKRLLRTAMAVKPDSFKWLKKWDKGHIFDR